MAKFFKQLGFGGKKAPPQPPKPDYSTLKSPSTDSQLACSPTSDRTSTSFATSTSNIGDFDTPPSGSLFRSGTTDRSGTVTSKVKDCCGGSVSPMSASERLVQSSSGFDDPGTPATMDTDLLEGATGGPNPSATPPKLLDEYSDPLDLRRQITEDMSGICAVPAVEDDYSVPYEVKKLIKEGQGAGGARRKTTRPAYETYDEPLKADDNFPSDNQRNMAHDSHDIRPKEDYDEPWELQKLALPAQLEQSNQNVQMLPPHFLITNQNKTPQLVKKTTIDTAHAKSPDTDGDSVVLDPTLEPKGKTHSSTVGQETPDYENTRIPAPPQASAHDPGSDEEGYTRLTTAQASVPTNGAKPVAAGGLQANYEEPWDLHATTKDIESKIKAAAQGVAEGSSGGAGGASAVSNGTEARASKLETAKSNTQGSHEADKRTQEGYEKPWDWKPHQKDDRPQEGYEKPWDWKPHQKDERPPEEYEPPWDNKAKEFDLQTDASSENKENASDTNRESDTRPQDEYDEPWDNKKTTASLAAAGSKENSPKSSQQSSPKKAKGKHLNLDLGCGAYNALGEKIDPNIPLEQQGWYHGSIGRVDAEKFLRVHKEGSYLVRMSESNKTDFSLSLKSARGFMHMKIVFKTNKYILGQFSQPFDSIPLMIHHYSVNKLPIRGAEHMSLLHPVINELL